MRFSVVVPAYNEEDTIAEVIEDVFYHMPYAELIIINDKSTDKTLDILRAMKRKYRKLRYYTNDRNMGHGATVIRGLMSAKGDYILYIDADRQISLGNIMKFKGDDFTSGYRLYRQDKFFRKIVSFCLKMTNLLRHGYYIKDANCPFKVYKRSSLIPLLLELPSTYIIPIACLEVLARRHKLKTFTIATKHYQYFKQRKGTLQSINRKSIKFFYQAFKEIYSL